MAESVCEHKSALTQALYGINPLGMPTNALASYSGIWTYSGLVFSMWDFKTPSAIDVIWNAPQGPCVKVDQLSAWC